MNDKTPPELASEQISMHAELVADKCRCRSCRVAAALIERETPRLRLADLRKATKALIDRAKGNRHAFRNEPINWGDLHCVEAILQVEESGAQSYRVVISEASESCSDFRMFIHAGLTAAGFSAVEVTTEW